MGQNRRQQFISGGDNLFPVKIFTDQLGNGGHDPVGERDLPGQGLAFVAVVSHRPQCPSRQGCDVVGEHVVGISRLQPTPVQQLRLGFLSELRGEPVRDQTLVQPGRWLHAPHFTRPLCLRWFLRVVGRASVSGRVNQL